MHWNRSVFVAAFVSIPLTVFDAAKPDRNGPRKGVGASFSLDAPADGPFPSDRFTVADDTQNTCQRINLPVWRPSHSI